MANINTNAHDSTFLPYVADNDPEVGIFNRYSTTEDKAQALRAEEVTLALFYVADCENARSNRIALYIIVGYAVVALTAMVLRHGFGVI